MSKKFLVAVDGSTHAWKALDLATDLAIVADAELVILHVVPYEEVPDALLEFARVERVPGEEMGARHHYRRAIGDKIISEAETRVRKKGLARITTEVVEGNPADEIVEFAKSQGADMVFFGSRGLGDVKSLLMGSVSHKVLHLSPCTCVAVK